MLSAYIYVEQHGKKFFVIAIALCNSSELVTVCAAQRI